MKPNQILTIDVGNTSTAMGFFIESKNPMKARPQKLIRISTPQLQNNSFLSSQLKRLLSSHTKEVVISSVVPKFNPMLRKAIRKAFHGPVDFVSYHSHSKIKIKVKHPREVGADRIVNARAAMALYKGPSIVVDFGTATTFDCVSNEGAYLGGVIAAGPLISAEALYERCVKLPFVPLNKPAKILGQTTLECIQSGLFHGYRGMVLEIVQQLKAKMGAKTRVFTTGGQAEWILKKTPLKTHFDPHLTLKGLLLIAQDHAK